MGRKKGFDKRKIVRIIEILYQNPDGLWLRGIAEEAKISPSTVAYYIETVLSPMVEDMSVGRTEKPLLRVIKLKPFVIQKLEEGASVSQILKILDILKDFD